MTLALALALAAGCGGDETFGDGDSGETDATEPTDDGADGSDGVDEPVPACGDGTLDPEELCDDGNTEGWDGCNAQCQPSGALQWSHELQGNSDQPGTAIAADGTVTLARVATSPTPGGNQRVLQRIDSHGDEVFLQREDSPNAWAQVGVGVSPDGAAVLAEPRTDADGNGTGSLDLSFLTASGTTLAAGTVDFASEGWLEAMGMLGDGRFVMLGQAGDPFVALFEADAEPAWIDPVPLPGSSSVLLAVEPALVVAHHGLASTRISTYDVDQGMVVETVELPTGELLEDGTTTTSGGTAFLTLWVGGPQRLLTFDAAGQPLAEVDLPPLLHEESEVALARFQRVLTDGSDGLVVVGTVLPFDRDPALLILRVDGDAVTWQTEVPMTTDANELTAAALVDDGDLVAVVGGLEAVRISP